MVKFNFKKNLTRKEISHIQALQKAQKTITVAIEKQEIQEQVEEENLLAKVQVRPKTPVHKETQRNMNKAQLDREDRKNKAIILLQRLIRGRAI